MLVELLPKSVRRYARRYIERRGFIPASDGPANIHTAMKRRPDIVVETVIDVGASNGCWSQRMMEYLPKATYLLVEAQRAAHGGELEKFKAAHPNVQYEICAAGSDDGSIQFDASDPIGGAASITPFAKNNIVVPMSRLDTLVHKMNLKGPFLIKLDTHGFELPILEGASETLSRASMLIIEAYNFKLCPGAIRFHELAAHVEQLGFRCVDIFDLMVRPVDNALWQMDMVFLPVSHSIFRSSAYQPE
jgi:FkbM family methyltransferase